LKNKLVNILKLYFSKAGFHIDRIPDVAYFKTKSALQLYDEIWYDLNRFSQSISISGNHKLYNEVLAELVPDFSEFIVSAQTAFVGIGKGNDTLNSYRRITLNGNDLFEKVYRTDSSILTRLLWFYEHVHPLLDQDKIRVPQIKKVLSGTVITIVYFEYAELQKMTREQILLSAIEIIRHLLSLEKSIDVLIPKAPENVSDYTTHEFNNIYMQPARRYAQQHFGGSAFFDKIEKHLIESKPFFAHADINSKNLFEDHFLIDWDTSGLYPMGCDVGKVVNWFYLTAETTAEDVILLLKNQFKNQIKEADFNQFLLGSLFFCFVFRASDIMFGNQVPGNMLNGIYAEIEKLFDAPEFKKMQ